jgi:hypothetical protein
MQVLHYIGKSRVDVLVQVWMLTEMDDGRVLFTMQEQPFVIEHKTNHHLWYY